MILENVCKSYDGRQVLHNVSCKMEQGSAWAILAPSGVGKTTLLRLILGLESQDSGTISDVPKRKSALFQDDRLFPNLTIPTNLRMTIGTPPETMPLLKVLGLEDALDTPAGSLSGGQSRRASLARALLAEGDLLTLDEPFTGLDEENRLAAAKAIRDYRRGRTLLLVTHRQEDLPLLSIDNILYLSAQSNDTE